MRRIDSKKKEELRQRFKTILKMGLKTQVSLRLTLYENIIVKYGLQIVSENKTVRDVEEIKKNLSRKTIGTNQQALVEIIKNFWKELKIDEKDIANTLKEEVNLIISVRKLSVQSHDLLFSLYAENGQPYSLTSQLDTTKIFYQEQGEFVFISISLHALLLQKLALIINVVEKKKAKTVSAAHEQLNTKEEFGMHRVYKGYTILPLSSLIWSQEIKIKQIYEMKEAKFYKQSSSFNIEDKYATLIDKRGFKRYTDIPLAKSINLSYIFKL